MPTKTKSPLRSQVRCRSCGKFICMRYEGLRLCDSCIDRKLWQAWEGIELEPKE